MYRAASLPVELAAPLPPSMDTIRLSNLLDRGVNHQRIQADDVLDVALVTDYNQTKSSSTPLRVAPDGTVVVPLVGKVAVAGLEPDGAERVIAEAAVTRGVFRNPSVTVTMKQRRTNRVVVVGAVNSPGTHELPAGNSSLLTAVVAAGGLSKDATPEVEIRRGPSANAAAAYDATAGGRRGPDATPVSYQQPVARPETVRVNLLTLGQSGQQPPELSDGDVVQVIKRDIRPIYVMGLVRKAGEFELPPNRNIRLLDAIAMAGDCSSPVADQVTILRQAPGQPTPVTITASIREAQNGSGNIPLAPGDVVTVPQTPSTVVVDTLQTFFRVGFSTALPGF